MNELLLAAAGLIVLAVAVGLARILRGSDVERLMAVQLLGTGGIAALLLIAYATDVPGVEDVALGLALLAAFDFYFPGLLGPLYPVPADYAPNAAAVARIAAALRAKPDAANSLLRIWGVGNLQTLPDILAFDYFEVGELQRRTRGNPFGNADLVYTGGRDDFALNTGVHRYTADAGAAAYLAKWYTPSGNLTRPLLALHDVGDPLVPASGAFEYALAVQRSGHAANFVQQFVAREGHCVFTPQEIGRAFDELVAWVHDGKRPISGALPGLKD